MIHGLINLDKPAGISSARAVAQVKRLLDRSTKIGHAGTLDPFATGVLLLLIGRATRQCEALLNAPKQYLATLHLGATTASDDCESPEMPFSSAAPPAPPPRSRIEAILPQFTGTILQRPPVYSALKIAGRRACDLARKGRIVELAPRNVRIYGIELLDYAFPLLQLRIDCGRGTYIRALARDLGQALQVGAYLRQLRRTRIGDFRVDQALTLEQLAADGVARHLIALA